MTNVAKKIVKYRLLIIVLAVLLLIPSVLGMMKTRINYDMLTYLPQDIDTVKGQNILLDEFNKGAFSILIVEDMDFKEIKSLAQKIEHVDHVSEVICYESMTDGEFPKEMLPKKYYDAFNNGDATLIAVFFDTSTSADETITAVENVRKIAGENCKVSGMSALVADLKELCEKEEPVYVVIAVVLACVTMMICLDSWILPFIFLASIGMAILLNLGSNYFLGEISYITKALSAVLQLAVTMDYSIFLWHSYCEQKKKESDKELAMAYAIKETFASVVGSSITTVAGFLALCFMSFTLGKDLGIVMAKGVILGVIGCVTTLPALIITFDGLIEKTRHKPLIPAMNRASLWISKHNRVFLILFIIILIPAFYGYRHTGTYYDLTLSLPKDMANVVASTELKEKFDMASTHMILCDSNMSKKDAAQMIEKINAVDGVKLAAGLDSVIGSSVPEEILPDSVKAVLKGDNYQLILVSSQYKVASDEANKQIDEINSIIKQYDKHAMLIGEAPCTKDLITITDKDFKVVNALSIIAIFIIILFVLKSPTLPVILVAVIEFAIFINLGIPYYTGTKLPFIAPICVSTIQLGATVDYAILMTTRYRKERQNRKKEDAVYIALTTSLPAILVSALGFFMATFGVALYSDIDMIRSMCFLMARGALISAAAVILLLPSLLVSMDSIICKTQKLCGIRRNRIWIRSM